MRRNIVLISIIILTAFIACDNSTGMEPNSTDTKAKGYLSINLPPVGSNTSKGIISNSQAQAATDDYVIWIDDGTNRVSYLASDLTNGFSKIPLDVGTYKVLVGAVAIGQTLPSPQNTKYLQPIAFAYENNVVIEEYHTTSVNMVLRAPDIEYSWQTENLYANASATVRVTWNRTGILLSDLGLIFVPKNYVDSDGNKTAIPSAGAAPTMQVNETYTEREIVLPLVEGTYTVEFELGFTIGSSRISNNYPNNTFITAYPFINGKETANALYTTVIEVTTPPTQLEINVTWADD